MTIKGAIDVDEREWITAKEMLEVVVDKAKYVIPWSIQQRIRERKKVIEQREADRVEAARWRQDPNPEPISHRAILSKPANPQRKCCLFTLPLEIRQQIFALAISDSPHPDASKRYSTTEVYHRPGYTAPLKVEYALLRSCRRIYGECWDLPNRMHEQVFWLTFGQRPWSSFGGFEWWGGGKPPGWRFYEALRRLDHTVRRVKRLHEAVGIDFGDPGVIDGDDVEDVVDEKSEYEKREMRERAAAKQREALQISDLRVFASPISLRYGLLNQILSTPDFHPVHITLTIRHVDWSGWQADQPLSLPGGWITTLSRHLSPATREILLQLETVERKKDQVEFLAAHVIQHWAFTRSDGSMLVADATGEGLERERWEGRSTYGFQRYVRDETEEGKIGYYVVGVPFREVRRMRQGGRVSEDLFVKSDAGDDGEVKTVLKKPLSVDCSVWATPLPAMDTITVPWEDTDQLGEEKKPKMDYFYFARCGNCREPPSWRKLEHPHYDRW